MKKLIVPILCFFLGLILSYFICKSREGKLTKDTLQQELISFLPSNEDKLAPFKSAPIDRAFAKFLIREFQTKPHLLETSGGMPLKAFYIDSAALNNILRQKDCAGIRIYIGMNPHVPGTEKKAYTLIFSGTKDDNGGLNGGKPLDIVSDVLYEFVDPCPDNCDTTGNGLDRPPLHP
jgi:hypothetical protein